MANENNPTKSAQPPAKPEGEKPAQPAGNVNREPEQKAAPAPERTEPQK
jgi:hypothetical protein